MRGACWSHDAARPTRAPRVLARTWRKQLIQCFAASQSLGALS